MTEKNRKAQIVEEVFKYGLVLVLAAIVVAMGYKFISSIKDRACQSEMAEFELEFRGIGKNVRQGEKELRSFKAPCNIDRIYVFDLNKSIDSNLFSDVPIIKDSIVTGSNNNVFLVKNSKVLSLFYAGDVEIDEPYYICFSTFGSSMDFFVEGQAKSVRITSISGQKLCK